MTRRVLATFVLSVALVLAVANVAIAAEGDSGYLPPGGVSPHGGYQVTTKKCAVCHAVHNAIYPGGEVLLRSTVADACTYCHITPGVSVKIVYDGVSANYTGSDFSNAHNSAGATPVQCTSCHQVHAATALMTDNAYLTTKILTKGPAYDADSDLPNNGEPQAGDADDLAVSKWCTKCHTYWPGVDVDTHVLTVADGTHAFTGSDYCSSCHNSDTVGSSIPTASAFPHYTDGARFLMSAATSMGGTVNQTAAVDSQYDGVCLRCHRNGSGSGIGQTF